MSKPDFQRLLDAYQSNMFPSMCDWLGQHLGVTAESVRRLGVGFAPIVKFAKGPSFCGWFTFPERDSDGTPLGLSLRSQSDFKVMMPASKHGLIFEINPEHELGAAAPDPGRWIRTMDAGVLCPVCGKADGCLVNSANPTDPEGDAICIRVKENAVKPMKFGYLHSKRKAIAGVSALPNNGGPIVVVEGASDCMAAMDLGFNAIGRPSNLACMDLLCDLVRGRGVIICGENDRKADGREPGREGMVAAFQAVRGAAKDVTALMPPSHVKDLRAWVTKYGLTREQFLEYHEKHKQTPADEKMSEVQIAAGDTDLANAKRFKLRHGTETRFSYDRGQWLVWTGTQWQRDETARTTTLAKETVLSILDEAKEERDDIQRTRLAKWAAKSQSRDRIAAMQSLAQDELPILANQLDSDPALLNVLNGTIDLRTGELRPHRREDFITKIAPVTYDPDAEAPLFHAFLDRIFRTKPGLIDYIQTVMGYASTGMVNEQVLIFPYGVGSNGKSTLLDLMLFIFGDYAGKGAADLLISRDRASHPTEVADLQGKRLVICSETKVGQRFDDGRLKSLIGEQRIKARYMGRDFFEFDATHKLFLVTNNKPVVRGTDQGFWRRIRIIPFLEVIGEDEKDTALLDKLKGEASGVLNWIVAGAVRWEQEGLPIPPEVADATQAYREENDTVGSFIRECCIVDPNVVTPSSLIYDIYRKWCEESGEFAESQTRLGLTLASRGFTNERDSRSGLRAWRGLRVHDALIQKNGGGTGRSRVMFSN